VLRREERMNKSVYGPVPSRRLGISLGVDVVPHKTCSYDCIYCQLGKTTNHTIRRKSFVSVDLVIDEIREVIDQNSDIDYITFSGSGEPTLNSDVGEMIRRAKGLSRIPVAVLTNGSLLWQREVREDLSPADLVVPSLDAVSEEVFRKVNRPVEGLEVKTVLSGIKEFCGEFSGKVYLEIMLVKGINDSTEEIKEMNQFAGELKLDKIQLNTVIRPPKDAGARPLDQQELVEVKALFDPSLPVEIVADFDRMTSKAYHKDLEQAILDLLRRRPTRKDEMATALGIHFNEIVKYLQVLEKNKKIEMVRTEGEREAYYVLA
jgi:wyosine [tRNA(Phe)-imidazoG37] synthetase (radical SAM superfamily)